MNKFIAFLIILLSSTLLLKAQIVDGQFVTKVNGTKFEVTVAASMQSGTGSAGVVSIDFSFNTDAMSFSSTPVNGTDYVLQGGFSGYSTKNITRPSSNTIRISLATTGIPVSLNTSPVNIVTFYFNIINASGASNLVWIQKQIAPLLTQPNYTNGNWPNLSVSLLPPSVDGQFITNINGTKYEVTVAANMHTGTGSAGVLSIEFTFNTSGLSFPLSPVSGTDYILQGDFAGYDTKNITRPANNKIRISLVKTGTPAPLTTTPLNIITLYLTILDPAQTSNLAWTKKDVAPAFLQANYASGTWNDVAAPLPVELTSFNAVVSGSDIILKWATATEVNNYGFEVERTNSASAQKEESAGTSSDGVWEVIGFVQGNGNSNSPKDYLFVDKNPKPGQMKYRIKQIDTDGLFKYYQIIAEVKYSITDVKDNITPKEFNLFQNFPNPFNPSTVIKYAIPENLHVSLKIYSILGKEIETLVDEYKQPGNYSTVLNGTNLATGVYIYEMRAGNYTSIKKLMVIK